MSGNSEEQEIKDVIDYEKSKSYWEGVDATNCGMLGNIPEISIAGKICFYH